jgi:hypothetical protein
MGICSSLIAGSNCHDHQEMIIFNDHPLPSSTDHKIITSLAVGRCLLAFRVRSTFAAVATIFKQSAKENSCALESLAEQWQWQLR